MYYGDMLFEIYSLFQQIAKFEKVLGPIPKELVYLMKDDVAIEYFNKSEKFFKERGTYLKWPDGETDEETLENYEYTKPLDVFFID